MKVFLFIRALFLLSYLVIATPILSLFLLLLHFCLGSRRVDDWVIRDLWAAPFLWLCGAKLEVRGLEHLQPRRGALLLFNHTSWIDIFVLFSTLDPLPRYGAKVELFKIPIFGTAMKAVGVLPIARDQREKVMQVYSEAAERVRAGEVFALAPEGTRQTELKIGPFKRGPFLFALRTPMPIMPTLIVGAREVMPKGEWLIGKRKFSYKIILEFLAPIETENLGEEALDRVQAETHSAMTERHQELLQQI